MSTSTYRSHASEVQSPCHLMSSEGSPSLKRRVAEPRLKLWPAYLLASKPAAVAKHLKVAVNQECVIADHFPLRPRVWKSGLSALRLAAEVAATGSGQR